MVIDGDSLVRQGVNAGDFRGECRIHQVAKGQALAFGQDLHDLRLGGEIQNRRCRRLGFVIGGHLFGHPQLKLFQVGPVEARRLGLFVFPAVDSGK